VFVSGKPFQPSLMFVAKARNLPQSEVHLRCSTQVGSSFTNIFRTFVIYGRKKFFTIGPRFFMQLDKDIFLLLSLNGLNFYISVAAYFI
jgi:hypothetical protein